ncbi:hypothetical protein GGF44_001861, partial [Coemansia sp. RSA 1694]
LASAEEPAEEGADFVMLQNEAYKEKTGSDYYRYDDNDSGECVNVKKIFNTSDTYIYSMGRSVKLYAERDCEDKFATNKASTDEPVYTKHAILSFK